MDWFLYDNSLRHERANNNYRIAHLSLKKINDDDQGFI